MIDWKLVKNNYIKIKEIIHTNDLLLNDILKKSLYFMKRIKFDITHYYINGSFI